MQLPSCNLGHDIPYGYRQTTRERHHDPPIELYLTRHIVGTEGENARLQKEYDQANAYYRDALAVVHESGDMLQRAFTLSDMGFSLIAQGDLRQAGAGLREGLSILSRASDLPMPGLWVLARLAELNEEPIRAARLHGAAELLEESASLFLAPADRQDISRNVARVRAQLGDAAYDAAWAEGQAMSREEAFAYAMEE